MKLLTTVFLGFTLTFCSSEETLLAQIKAKGELWVVTRNSPMTYHEHSQGTATGLEFELAKRFADELGVELHLIIADDYAEAVSLVANQEVHFAAAGLPITNERKALVRFVPSYQAVIQQLLIYRKDSPFQPRSLTDLTTNHHLKVIAGSSQVDLLNRLKKNNPRLTWEEISSTEPNELLEQIWENNTRYTILNSNEVAPVQRFYPDLQINFEALQLEELGWAFPRTGHDDSVYFAAINFFKRLRESGELEELVERYYGHLDTDNIEDISINAFYQHLQEHLPNYRNHFELVAARHHLDWRFLAAIGYQESHWNPKAISRTGVRGLMMLTKSTAESMGISNLEDPFESIVGGAKYFTATKDRILALSAVTTNNIQEPDHTWFALAAYNVGLGHLTDARRLTKQQGANPDRWVDVKKRLPLLTKPYWYKKTRHGYARGYEPVKFVKNVRHFYGMLVHADNKPDSVGSTLPVSYSKLPHIYVSEYNTPVL